LTEDLTQISAPPPDRCSVLVHLRHIPWPLSTMRPPFLILLPTRPGHQSIDNRPEMRTTFGPGWEELYVSNKILTFSFLFLAPDFFFPRILFPLATIFAEWKRFCLRLFLIPCEPSQPFCFEMVLVLVAPPSSSRRHYTPRVVAQAPRRGGSAKRSPLRTPDQPVVLPFPHLPGWGLPRSHIYSNSFFSLSPSQSVTCTRRLQKLRFLASKEEIVVEARWN